MGRPERRLDTSGGPVQRFAGDLRTLRDGVGRPSYREMSAGAHFSVTTLSDAAGGQRFPSLPVTLAYVRACGGDAAQWRARWRAVEEELAPARVQGAVGGTEAPCPYLGLAPYQPADSARFFGRERLLRDLVTRVRAHRFVAVFGASGSGKSSLLRAGLAARAMAGGLCGDGGQPTLVFTPGPHPVLECAVQLAALGGGSVPALRTGLAADAESLHLFIQRELAARPGEQHDLLLIVDQFEEVFTQCHDPAERAQFVAALLSAASAAGSRTRVVIGVRADFYGHCGGHAGLVEALNGAQLLVGPMCPDELAEAIVRPAAGAGLAVETALVARVVSDATGQPSALPLVSHALVETWRRRHRATLTVTGYQAAGGIRQAVAGTAEAVYDTLTGSQREVARQVFLRLVAVDEAVGPTPRRVARHEMDHGPETAAVLEKLVRGRLLTLHRDTVEVAHDALNRHWPRLRGWIDHDREGLGIRQHLAEATAAWACLGRDPSGLYRGARLARAQRWAERCDAATTSREREFLRASRTAEAAEHAAARSRNRTLRRLLALLAALVVLAPAAIAHAAARGRDAAIRQRQIAVSQQVLGQAGELRATDPALAAQLSLAAYRLAPTGPARTAVLNTFAEPYDALLGTHDGAVYAAAFASDSALLATAGADGARLWDLTDHGHARQLAVVPGDLRTVAVSPDGQVLATGGSDRTARLWDLRDPRRPRSLARLTGHRNVVTSVAFGPDGHTLATASADNTARLWDVADPARPRPVATLTGHLNGLDSVAFGPDGGTLATADADGTVRLWDLTDLHRPRALATLTGHTDAVTSVAFGPDGRTLATASADGSARLWNLADQRRPRMLATLTGHIDAVTSVAFGPDGRTLATASADGTARLWDLTAKGPPQVLATLTGHTGSVHAVAFSPDGRILATVSRDRTVRRIDLGATGNAAAAVSSMAFSPDGRILATGGERRIRLWDVTDPGRLRPRGTMAVRAGAVASVVFSPDGRTLATVSRPATAAVPAARISAAQILAAQIPAAQISAAQLWDVADPGHPRELAAVAGRTASGAGVAFSPDGRTLVVGTDLWDVTDPRHPLRSAFLTDSVLAAAFSLDGRTLVIDTDDRVLLWDVTDIRHPYEVASSVIPSPELAAAFSQQRDILATVSADRTVRLWDLADPRHPGAPVTLSGPVDPAQSVAFSPDGRTLATGSLNDTATLWDVGDPHRPQQRAVLTGHSRAVTAVAFSPDGQSLATGGADHTARLWDTDISRIAGRICDLARTPLTRTDWDRYLPGLRYQPPCT